MKYIDSVELSICIEILINIEISINIKISVDKYRNIDKIRTIDRYEISINIKKYRYAKNKISMYRIETFVRQPVFNSVKLNSVKLYLSIVCRKKKWNRWGARKLPWDILIQILFLVSSIVLFFRFGAPAYSPSVYFIVDLKFGV